MLHTSFDISWLIFHGDKTGETKHLFGTYISLNLGNTTSKLVSINKYKLLPIDTENRIKIGGINMDICLIQVWPFQPDLACLFTRPLDATGGMPQHLSIGLRLKSSHNIGDFSFLAMYGICTTRWTYILTPCPECVPHISTWTVVFTGGEPVSNEHVSRDVPPYARWGRDHRLRGPAQTAVSTPSTCTSVPVTIVLHNMSDFTPHFIS